MRLPYGSLKKIIYVSAVMTVSAILLKVWLFEAVLESGVKSQICLKKGTEVREIYLKMPFPLDFKIYFFNVTNPDEIQNGTKPIVKEVGPYWYDEWKEKVDIEDNDTEDSLTYTPYDLYEFNQEKSGRLKDDDLVTVVNPVLMALLDGVQKFPALASVIKRAIGPILNEPQTVFLTAKVKDILFDGLELNCTSDQFHPTAICKQMASQIPGLKRRKDNDKILLFSLLASRNATKMKRVKVLRGVENSNDLGRVMEVDGKRRISLWNSEECNRFAGTDGWIFPPLIKPEEGPQSYSPDICRSLKMRFENFTTMNMVEVGVFVGDLGDQSTDKSEKCYCPTKDQCLKRGLFDLSKCMKAPIIATLPHFFRADEEYLEKIDGLKPNATKHGLVAYFQMLTGTPIYAKKRMQFNFMMGPVKKVPLFENLPDVLFPMFWMEEGVTLGGKLLKKVQTVSLVIHMTNIFLYMLMVLGPSLLAISLYYFFTNRNQISITSVHQMDKSKTKKTPQHNGE